jgi:hypothetical protein
LSSINYKVPLFVMSGQQLDCNITNGTSCLLHSFIHVVNSLVFFVLSLHVLLHLINPLISHLLAHIVAFAVHRVKYLSWFINLSKTFIIAIFHFAVVAHRFFLVSCSMVFHYCFHAIHKTLLIFSSP